MKIKWGKLLFSIALPLAVGGLSAWLTRDAMDAFEKLRQPPLTPPGWLFGVVWGILYVLMGVALYRVRLSEASPETKSLFSVLFVAQLFFNFFWSIIFFNRQAFMFAFVWLIILWALIALLILAARKIDKVAFWCLVPYLVWVTFAGYLNLGVSVLN